MGIADSITPECTEPTTNSVPPRWIRLRILRAPAAGLDSVSSVTSSTLRLAMPPCWLMSSTAFLAAMSCQYPHDEITPVRSQWWPILIGPPDCAKRSFMIVRLAVAATVPPASTVCRKLRRAGLRFSISPPGLDSGGSLQRQPEVAVQGLGVRFQLGRRAGVHDGAFLHQQYARAQAQRRLDVLLDEQDRHAAVVDAADLAPDLRHEERHDALGGLVEDDELRPHHQAARDGEHLLLAARERAARLADTLLQAREMGEHVALDLAVGLAGEADAQVLVHAEIREDAAALRHVADAQARHLVGLDAREVHALELHLPGAALGEAHDGAQGRGLADAVASEERDRLAAADLERHAAQDVQLAVVHVHVRELKHHCPRAGRGRPRARARRRPPRVACRARAPRPAPSR